MKFIFLLLVIATLITSCAFSTYPNGSVVISPAPSYYYYNPYPYYYYWYSPHYGSYYHGQYWNRGYHHYHH